MLHISWVALVETDVGDIAQVNIGEVDAALSGSADVERGVVCDHLGEDV